MTAENSSDRLPAWNGRTLGLLLDNLGRRARRDYLRALVGLKLRDRDFPVLSYVSQHPRCAQQHVSAALHIDSGNLVAIIDRLERDGLLTRSSDPEDARRRLVMLTRLGLGVHRDAQYAIADTESALTSELSPAEAESVRLLLSRMLDTDLDR